MTNIFVCPRCGTETVMPRQALPDRRSSWTQKARVGGQSVHLNMGEYSDGSLGEIFLDMHKTGTAVRGFTSALARLFSVALQHGVPLIVLVKTLEGIDFPPQGEVQGEGVAVTEAKSILDWVVRELAAAYLKPADQPVMMEKTNAPEPVPERSAPNQSEGNEGREDKGPLP